MTALAYKSRVSGLVLAEPGFLGTRAGLTPAQEIAWARGRSLFQTADRESLDVALRSVAESEEEYRSLREGAASHDHLSLVAAHRGELSTEQPFEDLATLAGIDVPVLLLPGSDEVHSPAITDAYAEHLPVSQTGPPGRSSLSILAASMRDFVASL